MYKVMNLRRGMIGCSCTRKGQNDVLLLKSGANEVANDLWESILESNPERYEALEEAGDLTWRKLPAKSRKKKEPESPVEGEAQE